MTDQIIQSEDVGSEYTLQSIDADTADDLYLTSAGFEERTLTASQSLDADYRAEWGLIYVNSEYFDRANSKRTKAHLRELQDNLEPHCEKVDVIMGSWLEADKQLYSIREGFEDLNGRDELNITVDVTSFNREALLVCFNILYSISDNISSRILYTSPKEYGEWLTKGHRLVRNVIGFAGIQDSNKPTLLIVLSGFEQDRTLNTIEEIEPAKVLLGTGDPPVKEQFLDKNRQQQELVYSRQNIERFQFPADSIEKSYQKVHQLLSENTSEYNIVLCPMSTKLSTLGVWRAARQFQEVQLIYTIPAQYNLDGYSSGSDNLHISWL